MPTKTKKRGGSDSGKTAKAMAAPSLAPRRSMEDPFYWVEGQRADGVWQPLYCTSKRHVAKLWFNSIISKDEDDPEYRKEGLDNFEDFRVREPKRVE